jgi:feruloyl-CoA synthase
MTNPPRYRSTAFGLKSMSLARESDGTIRAQSSTPLDPYPRRLSDRFAHWAKERPQQILAAKRGSDGQWQSITWAEAHALVGRLGQALLDLGLSSERPLVILSDNDLQHLMLILAAQTVGVAYASVSQAYSLLSKDHAKLRAIIDLLTPGLVFAADGARFAAAIEAAVPAQVPLAFTTSPIAGRASLDFATLAATPATHAVEAARQAVGPDTVQKFLFTSGSTGLPKAVINTEQMVCANLTMLVQCLPALADAPVLLDWLPWSHTFGGNQTIGLTIFSGGTLYIDEGRPVPGMFAQTLANLREVAPTAYFNVPKGFEQLAIALAEDPGFARHFFSRLSLMFYAGAGLSQPVWDSLDASAERAVGERVPICTGLGMTETAPACLFTNRPDIRSGDIGLPCPGVDLKLVPSDDKLEIRYRGPNVTPGYWRNPQATICAFDEEGYFRSGDAVRFADPQNPDAGFRFDGRIAEDFKLATGTWVSVGPLRARLIALGDPCVQDVVLAGINRDEVGMLVFPNVLACRALVSERDRQAAPAVVLASEPVRSFFSDLLARAAAQATGSSQRVTRAILLDEPASIDHGEITDKGSINQRAVLTRRAALVEALYDEHNPAVIRPASSVSLEH